MMEYANRGATVAVPGTMTMLETIERARLEIASMLPHEVSITRTMRRTVDVNGRTVTLESAERRTMRYEYQGALAHGGAHQPFQLFDSVLDEHRLRCTPQGGPCDEAVGDVMEAVADAGRTPSSELKKGA